jgi:hypothetical protein
MFGLGFSYRPRARLALDVAVGGFTSTPVARGFSSGVIPSVSLSGLLGARNHSLEFGASSALALLSSGGARPVLGPHLGYRFQPLNGGLFVRATVHGVINLSNGNVFPWPGVSLGGTWDS